MRTEINKRPNKGKPEFPKLVTSAEGDCVLLALKEVGCAIKAIVIKHPNYQIGYTSEWPSSCLVDFEEAITLSND